MPSKIVVRAAAPRWIVLVGSVARGDEGPDSDLDLLVVVDRLDPVDRTRLISAIRRAIGARAPIDVFVTDLSEYERRKDVIGPTAYWPAREGDVVCMDAPREVSVAARSWLVQAAEDLATARRLVDGVGHPPRLAAFLAHLAAEGVAAGCAHRAGRRDPHDS